MAGLIPFTGTIETDSDSPIVHKGGRGLTRAKSGLAPTCDDTVSTQTKTSRGTPFGTAGVNVQVL